jgi:hypothetical protein
MSTRLQNRSQVGIQGTAQGSSAILVWINGNEECTMRIVHVLFDPLTSLCINPTGCTTTKQGGLKPHITPSQHTGQCPSDLGTSHMQKGIHGFTCTTKHGCKWMWIRWMPNAGHGISLSVKTQKLLRK